MPTQLIRGNVIATPTSSTTPAQYAAAQSQGFTPYSGGSSPTTPTPQSAVSQNATAPTTSQTPQNPSNLIQLGGKSYDLSTPDGLKNYQTDYSNVTKPNQQPNQQGIQVGAPSMTSPAQNAQTPTALPSPEQNQQYSQQYNQAHAQLSGNKSSAPQDASTGRAMVQEAANAYQPPQQPYQPSQNFMQYGDPIMQSFVGAALAYQQDVINTGYTAKALQTEYGNQVQGLDLQAANLQNIMNGSRDDIRAEISKAGGFATESQIEGLVTTRNRDLLKQYNNIELQKQTMQNQMNLQVGLAQADHNYAVDKFDNLTKTATMYKGIYDNATDQVDKLVQNVGYSGLAAAYNYDPGTLSMVEQHLNMPQGTLSDPQSLQQLDTYRQQSLQMSQQRLGMSQERLNIYVGNNTANAGATGAQAQYYATTGQVPAFKNAAQANAFWQTIGAGDPNTIADAQANKNIRTAMSGALSNQQTQYSATQTALGTVDKQLNLLSGYVNGDASKGLKAVDRSGVPLINRYNNFIAGNYSGDKDVTALNNVIKTASNEFAKILGGSAASISGTPVSTQHDAEALLNSAMNKGQLNTVINLMRQEGQFRLSAQKETIDSINNNLRNIGKGQPVQSSSAIPNTQVMTGPGGKKFNVPIDKVDTFEQHGYQ